MDYFLSALQSKSEEEFIQEFVNIPAGCDFLYINGNALGQRKAEVLIRALKAIPASAGVLFLFLANNQLEKIPSDKLAEVLAAIPKSVKYLDLSGIDFEQISEDGLKKVFSAHPSNVVQLKLGGNLAGKTAEDQLKNLIKLKQALPNLSKNIKELELVEYDFEETKTPLLAQVLSAIPNTVKRLNLSCNRLGSMPANELALALSQLAHKGIKELDLSENNLEDILADELSIVFAAIPDSVEILNISGNCLNGEQLEKALRAISATSNIKTLDLSRIPLGNLTVAELEAVFAAIPPSVENLILSGTLVDCDSELAKAFKALPTTIKSLDLSGGVNAPIIVEVLDAISDDVKIETLNLSYSLLGFLEEFDLKAIFSKIPPSVENLILLENFFAPNTCGKLASALKVIRAKLIALDLSRNFLEEEGDSPALDIFPEMDYDLTEEESPEEASLTQVFKAFPGTLETLYLSNSHLGRQPHEILLDALSELPTHVKSVNLNNNELWTQEEKEIKELEYETIIQKARESNTERTVTLSGNGKSFFSQAFLPLIGMIKQGMFNIDIMNIIVSFLVHPRFVRINTGECFFKQRALETAASCYSKTNSSQPDPISKEDFIDRAKKIFGSPTPEHATNLSSEDGIICPTLRKFGLLYTPRVNVGERHKDSSTEPPPLRQRTK